MNKAQLEAFFREYEARFSRAMAGIVDAEETASAFADCFVEASPHGVMCGKNDEQFRKVIPQGFDFYRSIGTKSMKVASLNITSLDDYHAMAKVHWRTAYLKKDGREEVIDFDVIYLMQMLAEKPKIFAYITGDEQKALRDRGLIS